MRQGKDVTAPLPRYDSWIRNHVEPDAAFAGPLLLLGLTCER